MRKQYSSRYFPYPGLTGIWISWDANGNKQCFNTEAGAIDHAKPNAIHYGGFTIAPNFNISKNGKLVWDMVESLQEAKDTIDASNQRKDEQLRAKPALCSYIGVSGGKHQRWIDSQAEKQLREDER